MLTIIVALLAWVAPTRPDPTTLPLQCVDPTSENLTVEPQESQVNEPKCWIISDGVNAESCCDFAIGKRGWKCIPLTAP